LQLLRDDANTKLVMIARLFIEIHEMKGLVQAAEDEVGRLRRGVNAAMESDHQRGEELDQEKHEHAATKQLLEQARADLETALAPLEQERKARVDAEEQSHQDLAALETAQSLLEQERAAMQTLRAQLEQERKAQVDIEGQLREERTAREAAQAHLQEKARALEEQGKTLDETRTALQDKNRIVG
jgi:chromosome segregation ATPase